MLRILICDNLLALSDDQQLILTRKIYILNSGFYLHRKNSKHKI